MSFEGILGYKAPNLPLIPVIVQGKLEGELAMYQKSFQAAFSFRAFLFSFRAWPCGVSAIWKKIPHKI